MKGLVVFARENLGLLLYPGQARLLEAWAASGKRKAVLVLGRRWGKTLVTAVAALHNATIPDYTANLRPGERRYIVIVATGLDQAREVIRMIKELLAAAPDPELAEMYDERASTLDEVVFRQGVIIRAMPCSSRSTRGLPISLVILDEAGHMSTAEDGPAAGKEVYRALLPSTGQFGARGYVMLTSTPMWSSGVLWELFNAGLTGRDPSIFASQQPTWEGNPSPEYSRQRLEPEFVADPDYARREWGAEFIEGAGAFLSAEAIHDCVCPGRTELPPLSGSAYAAAMDPAFAAGGDAFTLAIAHLGDGGQLIIDRVDAWRGRDAPLSSDAVLDEIADTLRDYGIRAITSDQYAVVPLSDGLRRRGIEVLAQPLSSDLKADIYTTLKRTVNTGSIELLDDPATVAELVNLEIRPTRTGKPRIQAASNKKDDRAMVVATVCFALSVPAEEEISVYMDVKRGELTLEPPIANEYQYTISPF